MAFMFPVVGKSEWNRGSWMPNTRRAWQQGRTHSAIDIYAERGQKIISPVGGTVKNFGSGNIAGNWIQIQGSDGNVYFFGHMDQPVTGLEKGQKVSGGTAIGLVGNTGSASGTSTHVHFSVTRDGKKVNPATYLGSAVIAPAITIDPDLVGGSSPAPWTDPDYWNRVATQDISPTDIPDPSETQTEAPAWFDQLAEYRKDLSMQTVEDPVKLRASEMMRMTLAGMANMVRRSGFQTSSMGSSTVEGVADLEREEGER